MLEAPEPGAVTSWVARRHDMGPQQLFGWLREGRKGVEVNPASFVPVTVEAPALAEAPPGAQAPDAPAVLARGAQ